MIMSNLNTSFLKARGAQPSRMEGFTNQPDVSAV